MTTATPTAAFLRTLHDTDPEIAQAIADELHRQNTGLELIASENFVSPAVLAAMGTVMTNKYAEGYPGKRYYGGCEFVDVAEALAINRAKALFGAEHANVQPHSGAQANMSIFLSMLQPGDTILGMSLAHGGHLTHGHPLNFSGKYFTIVPYGVRQDDEHLDYEELERKAHESTPKLIIVGASAYPRTIDFARIAAVARAVGARLMTDMAHIAGLVAAGVHPSPIPHSDYVTTTTHKTLRGPRGGLILSKAEHAKDVDRALFPGVQGGPLMHIIAAKAVCFKEAAEPAFTTYQQQVVANATALAAAIASHGFRIVSGGTDNHLMLVDVFSKGITGKVAEAALGKAGITVNKNAIPFDKNPPMVASGIRIGTPAITTRGMKDAEMARVGDLIARVLSAPEDAASLAAVKTEVERLCEEFPLYPDGSLALRVDQVFDASGELARVLDGYEPRASQRTLAVEIARAFDDGGRLLAEAGTGTGKTLAYLVPAILSGRRALISTGTKNLQEQILQKDLPILRSALDRPFKAVCMKGRGNYLCKHRWTQFREQPVIKSAADRIALTLVDEWSGTTRSGDRAEIDELPEDVSFWNDVSASTENCMGSSCQQYSECFITTMRQEAAEADLVVVNHHLLCADAAIRQHSFGEVIPECELLVIDEAHQLEDIATQYFGVGASNFRLDELVRDGERLVNQKRIGNKIQAADLRAAIVTTSLNGKAFFTDLTMRRPGQSRGPRQSDGLFDERLRLSAEVMEDVFEAGFMLVQALDQWAGAVTLVEDADEDLKALGKRAADFRDDLRFLLAANDPSFVFFLEIRGRGTYLRAMPIDVSSIVREHLLERPRAAVLTSATLCVNGEFGYVRARLGVREADEVRLPSEFDHARQSLLYLPRSMPDPRSPEFVEHAAREVVEILQRSEGRAFVLFTSYANLRDVHARIAPRLPYPMLVQGSAPRTQLVEQFRRTPNAVLLATSSFWQGVDVVGDALSCVIIDKLPFASPGDPIVQARIEAITERGGDAFHGYQVPLAILALLQGLGRLLRHREDRGVLAVLDPRLKTMGYGRRFLASLPPSPVTHRIDDVAKFFAS